IRDHAPGCLEDRYQRHDVVRLELRFDDGVDEPGCEHRVVVAVAAEAVQEATLRERREGGRGRPREHRGVRRSEHCARERRASPGFESIAPVALDQPAAARSPEENFLEHGLREKAEHRKPAVTQPDERAPERRAGHERARTVDRIDEPRVVGTGRSLACFLGADAMLRISLDDVRSQHAFDRAIRARHRIESRVALVLDRERAPKVRLCYSSGGAREIEREVFELENRNSFRAAIIEARRSALLVRIRSATTDGERDCAKCAKWRPLGWEEVDRLRRRDAFDVALLELEQQHSLHELLLELLVVELRRDDLALRDAAVRLDGQLQDELALERRVLAQRSVVERIDRALVDVEDALDLLAAARGLVALAGALRSTARDRKSLDGALDFRRGAIADTAAACVAAQCGRVDTAAARAD